MPNVSEIWKVVEEDFEKKLNRGELLLTVRCVLEFVKQKDFASGKILGSPAFVEDIKLETKRHSVITAAKECESTFRYCYELLSKLGYLDEEKEVLTGSGEELLNDFRRYYKGENADILPDILKGFLSAWLTVDPRLMESLKAMYQKGYLRSEDNYMLELTKVSILKDGIFSHCIVESVLQSFVYPESLMEDDENPIYDNTIYVEGITDGPILNTASLALRGKSIQYRIISLNGAPYFPKQFNKSSNFCEKELNVLGILDADAAGCKCLESPELSHFEWCVKRYRRGKGKKFRKCEIRLLPVPCGSSGYFEICPTENKIYGFDIENLIPLKFFERNDNEMQRLIEVEKDKNRFKLKNKDGVKTEFARKFRKAFIEGKCSRKDFRNFEPIIEIIEEKFSEEE